MRSKPDDYESLACLWSNSGGTSEWRDHADKCAMTALLSDRVDGKHFLLLVLDNYHSRWDAMLNRADDGYTMVSSTTRNICRITIINSHTTTGLFLIARQHGP
jgi:hypothetical protein